MINKQSLGIGIAILALVVSGFAVYLGTPGDSFSGGSQSWTKHSFMQGFWAGTGRQLNVTNTGNVSTSGTLAVTGATTLSSTLAVTATTTLSSGLTLVESVACVNFNATSTATAGSLTFVTTGATSTHAGTVYWDYGACN